MFTKNEKLLLWILFSSVFVYLILRAVLVPITHDEIATFFYYVQPGDFIPFKANYDANNHFINSALTFLFYKFFGNDAWSLRLSNLIFFPLYFYYLVKLSLLFKDKILQWCFILSLVLFHNFIEWFAISRGYGMSMALLIAALYYYCSFYRVPSHRNFNLGTLFITLATLASLALVYCSVILMAMSFVKLFIAYKSGRKIRLKKYLPALILFKLVLIFEIIFSLKLKVLGLLYNGNLDGFFDTCITSFVKMMFDSKQIIYSYVVVAIALVLLVLHIKSSFKNKVLFNNANFFAIVLVLNVIATIAVALLLKVNYPEDRAGLYFVLLFVLAVFFVINELDFYDRTKQIIAAVITFFFVINFLFKMNVSYISLWRTERFTEDYYNYILKEAKTKNYQPTIGSYHMNYFKWVYHNYNNGSPLSVVQMSDYPSNIYDFQIANCEDTIMFKKDYRLIATDKYSGLSLMERNNKLQAQNVSVTESNFNFQNIDSDFFNFLADTISIESENLYVDIDAELNCNEVPIATNIVFSTEDMNGNVLSYEAIPINFIAANWQNKSIHQTMLLKTKEKEPILFKCYVWRKTPQDISAGKVRLRRYVKL